MNEWRPNIVIVFDVMVDGEVKETIKPMNVKLKLIYDYVLAETQLMKEKYGNNIYLNRRMEY